MRTWWRSLGLNLICGEGAIKTQSNENENNVELQQQNRRRGLGDCEGKKKEEEEEEEYRLPHNNTNKKIKKNSGLQPNLARGKCGLLTLIFLLFFLLFTVTKGGNAGPVSENRES